MGESGVFFFSGLGSRGCGRENAYCLRVLLLLYQSRILTIAPSSFPTPSPLSLGRQHPQHQAAHRPILRYLRLSNPFRGLPQRQDALVW
jgi:hypothetical protein